jgi:hypothetical protein
LNHIKQALADVAKKVQDFIAFVGEQFKSLIPYLFPGQ